MSDDLFLVSDFSDLTLLFPDFPYLCYVWPFSHKKNTFFYSVDTFTCIRQHYFSKYWGGTNAWAVPPPQIFGGSSPPVPP